MGIHLQKFWMRLHWTARIAMLGVLLDILWWQARYIWTVHNPMYGWPFSFNNVWHGEWRRDWLLSILVVDAAVWLALVAAVGYMLEQWRSRPKRFQITLSGLFVLQLVVAIVLALGCAEGYLRLHPNDGSIFPAYARWEVGGVSLWFDIGLFTDPFDYRPLARLTILLAIGCFVYTAICLSSSTVRRYWGGRPVPAQIIPSDTRHRDPLLVRIVLFILAVLVLVILCGTIFPPATISARREY